MRHSPFLRLKHHRALHHVALLILLSACLLLAACGFKLKGATPLPFDTLYTNIAQNSAFGVSVRRAIVAASPNTRIVEDPNQAEARLVQLGNNRRLRELSIDADGRVEEYELNLEFIFQLVDSTGRLILPPTTLRTIREIPYDDTQVQAKQSEISTVFQQMQQSLVDRVLRLLSAPDIAEAFANVEQQPVDESPVDLAPVTNDSMPVSTDIWGSPDLNPHAPRR